MTYIILGFIGLTFGLIFESLYLTLYVPIKSLARYAGGTDKTANPLKIAGSGLMAHILILGGIIATFTNTTMTNVNECPDCASKDVEYDGGIDWKCLQCGYEFDEFEYRA